VEFARTAIARCWDYHKAFSPGAPSGSGHLRHHRRKRNLLGCNLTHKREYATTRDTTNTASGTATALARGAARFEIPKDRMQPWRIRTEDGAVDLQLVRRTAPREGSTSVW